MYGVPPTNTPPAPSRMFRLAHIADPHIAVVPPRLHELLNKRATGDYGWRRGRRARHRPEIAAALVADMRVQGYDHIACTGDLCNLGLPDEWEAARAFLTTLGAPERVSLVPGNHDAYVRRSLDGLLSACADWTAGDDGRTRMFPYLRRRGPLALIGLSSAVPTGLDLATGCLGRTQIDAAETLLRELGAEDDPPCRVVLIHHPPYPGSTSKRRRLEDAAAFIAAVARAGAELILHGHNHYSMMAFLEGPGGVGIPVVGAPSASSTDTRPHCRAAYHAFTIVKEGPRYRLTATERGFGDDGQVQDFGPIALERNGDRSLPPSRIPMFDRAGSP